MRYLLNNIEQRQPNNRSDTLIDLYARPASDPKKAVCITVYGFDPYFYAPADEVSNRENVLLGSDSISGIEYADYNLFKSDASAAKITTPKPQDVPEAKQLFDETYAADVPFVNRFLIDTGIRAYFEAPASLEETSVRECHWRELKPVEPDVAGSTPTPNGPETTLRDVEPRVVTLDIEVDDRGEGFPENGDDRILSIVAHDSYTDQTATFLDTSDITIDESVDVCGAPNEKQMLMDFVSWFQERDPDIVTGWNVDDFDIPYIIQRFEEIGLPPKALARDDWAGITRSGEPRLKGRTVYDMLTVYKKNQFTNIRSYTLDYVAKKELGAEKVEFEGTYYDLYTDDTETFLEYAITDVDLTVGINDEAGVIEFRDALRREVGVMFEESYDNKDFVEMMCRRKLDEWDTAGPTAPPWHEVEDSDYEGGFVLEPYEGVAENVVGIDLASLYPYTMKMLNASPETKVDSDASFAEELLERQQVRAKNGQVFDRTARGVLSALVEDGISLKQEYKERLQNAESDAEAKRWEIKYGTAKTITNSLYGVAGWEPFFLYDEDVAEAVTLTGQFVIKETAKFVEGVCGYDVVYGDTDSVYIKFPDEWNRGECLHEARSIAERLNGERYPELAQKIGLHPDENMWEIEVEVFLRRFFQAGKKKRYAYLAEWKDGRLIESPKPTIKGFHSKRSDTSQLTVDTEEAIFDAILHGNNEKVGDIVYDAAEEITCDEPDLDYIGIPGGMNQKIDEEKAGMDGYYAFTNGSPKDAHPRGVWNSNIILTLDIGVGDKPKRIYIMPREFEELGRSADVLAFLRSADLDPIRDRITVDRQRMINTAIVNPLDKICSAIGVDVSAAVKGQTQTNLGAFG